MKKKYDPDNQVEEETNANSDSTNTNMASVAPVAAPVAAVSQPVPVRYTNSQALVWPTDIWGFTSELRTALIHAASKINGHEDKKKLFDATLALGLKHVEAKYAEKQPERDVRAQQAKV